MKQEPTVKRLRTGKDSAIILKVMEWQEDYEWCEAGHCPCLTCPLWIDESLEDLQCSCAPCNKAGIKRPDEIICWRTSGGWYPAHALRNGERITIVTARPPAAEERPSKGREPQRATAQIPGQVTIQEVSNGNRSTQAGEPNKGPACKEAGATV